MDSFNLASHILLLQFCSVQSLSRVWLFATPWIAARQASLSITNSWSSPKLMWCHPAISYLSLIIPNSHSIPFLLWALTSYSLASWMSVQHYVHTQAQIPTNNKGERKFCHHWVWSHKDSSHNNSDWESVQISLTAWLL